MNPIKIIERYYNHKSKLYSILIEHSTAVKEKAVSIAKKIEHVNVDFIEQAAMIHDIGIFLTNAPDIQCFGSYPYLAHGYLGRELVEKEGFLTHALICERHTGVGLTKEQIIENSLPLPKREMFPVSLEEKIICYADKFYSKSAKDLSKEKSIDSILKSLSKHGEHQAFVFKQWHERFSDI